MYNSLQEVQEVEHVDIRGERHQASYDNLTKETTEKHRPSTNTIKKREYLQMEREYLQMGKNTYKGTENTYKGKENTYKGKENTYKEKENTYKEKENVLI